MSHQPQHSARAPRPSRIVQWSSAIGAAILMAGCTQPPPEAEPVRAVRTLSVTTGSAGGAKEYAAEVRARTEARLGFRVGGKLTQRPAEVGQVVRPGQVLAQLDPEDLRQAQQAAAAAVTAAEAAYEQQKGEYQRFKDLRDQGFISSWDLERRGATLKTAQAQLEQARAQAQVQRNQAGYATLLATGAGVVTAVEAEPGAVVSAGTPIVRLALNGPRDVAFSVPEDAVLAVRALVGRTGAIQVRLGSEPTPRAATVREVAASADASTRTFLAKADVGDAPAQLGQTATVVMPLPRAENIVKLPVTAVVRGEDATRSAVWIVDKPTMTVRKTPVTVGGAEGNEVVISAGLAPGQEVVTAGAHLLTQGQKVKFYETRLATAPASPATR